MIQTFQMYVLSATDDLWHVFTQLLYDYALNASSSSWEFPWEFPTNGGVEVLNFVTSALLALGIP